MKSMKLGSVYLMPKTRMEEDVFKIVTNKADLALEDETLIFTGSKKQFKIPIKNVESVRWYNPDIAKMHGIVFVFYVLFATFSWVVTGVDIWVLAIIGFLVVLHWSISTYYGTIFPWLQIQFKKKGLDQTLYVTDSSSFNFFDFQKKTQTIHDEIHKLL